MKMIRSLCIILALAAVAPTLATVPGTTSRQRTVPLNQDLVLIGSTLPAKAVEKIHAQHVMALQQINRDVDDHVAQAAAAPGNATPIVALGSTTALTLAEWMAQVVNVKAFGAKGDGVNDDTAAIQAAIDSVRPAAETVDNAAFANPVRVFLPKGTYLVSTPVLLYTGIWLDGVGPTSVLNASAGFTGTGILKQGSVGSGTYFQHVEVTNLAFKSAAAGKWALDFSTMKASQSLFQDLAIYTARGINLSLYAQNCTLRRVRSYGALDQLLWLKGNWNLVEDLDKEGTTGSTADPYILVEDHGLDSFKSNSNVFRRILIEGTCSAKKVPIRISGVQKLTLEDVYAEPTLTNGYILHVSDARQMRVLGSFGHLDSHDRRVRVETNSDLYIQEFSTDQEVAGRVDEMLEIDSTSHVEIDRLVSRSGSGNTRVAGPAWARSEVSTTLLGTPAAGYTPATSVRPIIARNLLTNGSFELSEAGWSWTGRPADTKTWSGSENIPGSLMGTFGVTTPSNSVIYQNITISAAMVGKPFTVSALVKITGPGTLAIWTEGTGISGAAENHTAIAKDGWAIIASTVKAQRAGTLQIGVIAAKVNATSTWQIDEVSFSPGTEAMLIPGLPDPLHVGSTLAFGTSGSKTQDYGAAAPVSGSWNAGSLRWNSAPAVGQPKGWVCTVSGSPGTWVSMGNL